MYIELNICNMNDVYYINVKKSIFLLDFVLRFYDVGKVLYHYCTSTFPMSTLFVCVLYGGTYISRPTTYVIVLWK